MAADGPRPEFGPIFDAPLSPDEDFILDNLIEECAEVIHAASKLKRFGRRPTDQGKVYDNISDLSREVGQLKYVVNLCMLDDLIDSRAFHQWATEKAEKMPRYRRRPT